MKYFEVNVAKQLKNESLEAVLQTLHNTFKPYQKESDRYYLLSGFFTGIFTPYQTNSYVSDRYFDNIEEICIYILSTYKKVWYGCNENGFYFRAKKGMTKVLHVHVFRIIKDIDSIENRYPTSFVMEKLMFDKYAEVIK